MQLLFGNGTDCVTRWRHFSASVAVSEYFPGRMTTCCPSLKKKVPKTLLFFLGFEQSNLQAMVIISITLTFNGFGKGELLRRIFACLTWVWFHNGNART